MVVIGTLSGSGDIKADGAVIGFGRYSVTLSERGGVRRGEGTLSADPSVLIEATMATELFITRQDTAKDMSIVITKCHPGDETVRIVLSGSPG